MHVHRHTQIYLHNLRQQLHRDDPGDRTFLYQHSNDAGNLYGKRSAYIYLHTLRQQLYQPHQRARTRLSVANDRADLHRIRLHVVHLFSLRRQLRGRFY